jgi:OOP family OmpA-OmpF porin
MKQFIILVCSFALVTAKPTRSWSQVVDPGTQVKTKGERRANERIDQSIDRGFDKLEEGIGNMLKGKVALLSRTFNKQN